MSRTLRPYFDPTHPLTRGGQRNTLQHSDWECAARVGQSCYWCGTRLEKDETIVFRPDGGPASVDGPDGDIVGCEHCMDTETASDATLAARRAVA